MMNAMDLQDGSIRLRPWTAEDAPWYARSARDAQIQRFTSDPPTLTAEQVADAIAALGGNPDQEGFLIADAASGERLGNIAMMREGEVGEVSYWIAAKGRGRGAAARALVLFARWVFARSDVAELRLWTHADNLPSRVVAERAGFARDPGWDKVREVKGELWPTVAYRLLRE